MVASKAECRSRSRVRSTLRMAAGLLIAALAGGHWMPALAESAENPVTQIRIMSPAVDSSPAVAAPRVRLQTHGGTSARIVTGPIAGPSEVTRFRTNWTPSTISTLVPLALPPVENSAVVDEAPAPAETAAAVESVNPLVAINPFASTSPAETTNSVNAEASDHSNESLSALFPLKIANPFVSVTPVERPLPAEAPAPVEVLAPIETPAPVEVVEVADEVEIPSSVKMITPVEPLAPVDVENSFESWTVEVSKSSIDWTSYNQPKESELVAPPELDAAQQEDEDYSSDQWTPRPIDTMGINVSMPDGVFPRDYAAERPREVIEPFDPQIFMRGWAMTPYLWEATNFRHRPLYFEEMNLERHGYGCCHYIQPAVSAAHFFGTVPMLPYLMAVDCPCDCDYTLGRYRPGSCVPWRPYCTRPSILGSANQGLWVYGLILLIP